jgi:hypothetical protein
VTVPVIPPVSSWAIMRQGSSRRASTPKTAIDSPRSAALRDARKTSVEKKFFDMYSLLEVDRQ